MSGSGVGCPECYPHPRHIPGECECCDCQSNSRTSEIADWLAQKAQADLDEHVSPEIQALLRRGNVTPAEVAELRCNSWEWELLVQVMTDDAFVARVEHALKNCSRHRQPFASYDEAVQGLYAPELLRRFKELRDTAIPDASIDAVGALASRARIAAGIAWEVGDGGNRTPPQEPEVRNILRDCARMLEYVKKRADDNAQILGRVREALGQ